ncbi:MAG TPA: hypothetical protein VHU19_17135 [Pyrinomonadaceae bacterium]|jgi:hypothetical protein|nr:hypothetical protein [Pyrinomonadaceae bacterium]
MKIEELQQSTIADEEETLVAPRFDEEETLVARRVVPLRVVEARAHGAMPEAPPVHTPPPRRPRVLALALASALVGGIAGGAGLYLYQSRSSANPSPAANAPEHANAPAELAQPAQPSPQPAPTAETAGNSAAPAEQSDAAADESGPQVADGSKIEDRAGAEETVQSPAAVRGEDARGTLKHGKKGQHEEIGRLGRRADSDRQPSFDGSEDEAYGDSQHHHVDTIFGRPRRTSERDHARRERPHSVDSIRGIFEGQPQ